MKTVTPGYSVIVFQMGKVGSKTVQESLEKAYQVLGQNVKVYHSHILTGFDESEKIIRRERPNPDPSLAAIANGRALKKRINESPEHHQWKIISLVRDPVARNIATFFENLDEFVPQWYEQKQNIPALLQKMREAFLGIQTIHSEPYRWFDEQMLPVFGVDVFSDSFPCHAGYKIYNPASRTPVLVIRLEDLNHAGTLAMKEFLGLDNFKIYNTNIGENKEYAELYRLFKQETLPDEYIQSIYSSKYAHAFYTQAEIQNFTEKWLRLSNSRKKSDTG